MSMNKQIMQTAVCAAIASFTLVAPANGQTPAESCTAAIMAAGQNVTQLGPVFSNECSLTDEETVEALLALSDDMKNFVTNAFFPEGRDPSDGNFVAKTETMCALIPGMGDDNIDNTRKDIVLRLMPQLDVVADEDLHNVLQAIGEGLPIKNMAECKHVGVEFQKVRRFCDKLWTQTRTGPPLRKYLDEVITQHSQYEKIIKDQNDTLYVMSYPLWAGIFRPASLDDNITSAACYGMESRRRQDDEAVDEAINVMDAVVEIQRKMEECGTGKVDYNLIFEIASNMISAVASSVGAEKEYVLKSILHLATESTLNWCSEHWDPNKFLKFVRIIVARLGNHHRMPRLPAIPTIRNITTLS